MSVLMRGLMMAEIDMEFLCGPCAEIISVIDIALRKSHSTLGNENASPIR